MSRPDKAEENFRGGFNCAQSVLLAFAGDLGADTETAEKMARGFGSGMGTGDTCGAVSGGVMAIGLFVKRISKNSSYPKYFILTDIF